ncbi:Target of EGR1 protein 1 [Sarcoptes scabiei]|uniref:Target of EGR1 protein 1 n=2 Tax=Sarcoptes scabiei TaxID=52283 RepID=A0A834VF22_SARSC|nr:Target of EGR1 protein 1 [Sarcoptes scabiei]
MLLCNRMITKYLISFTRNLDERYSKIKDVASTRSVVSLGISCFKIINHKGAFRTSSKQRDRNERHDIIMRSIRDMLDPIDSDALDCDDGFDQNEYHVQAEVFDFLTLNQTNYVTDLDAEQFLRRNGFDFEKLKHRGIPYRPGNQQEPNDYDNPSIRSLICLIVSVKPRIIVHNGLLDLAFLYQNFYSELPKNFQMFMADLNALFSKGIYDTKLIGTFFAQKTYLEYLYHSSLRRNLRLDFDHKRNLIIEFNEKYETSNDDIKIYDLGSKIMKYKLKNQKICENYQNFGSCELRDSCQCSHNIDIILDEELSSKNDRVSQELKFQLKMKKFENVEADKSKSTDQFLNPNQKIGSHHAGNDAFMTGYYFIYSIIRNQKQWKDYKEFLKFISMEKFRNKIFIGGCSGSALVMKSAFTRTSMQHQEHINKIFKTDWIKNLDRSDLKKD